MRTFVVVASCAAVIGLAAPAQAEPSAATGADASFLAALDKAGITYQNGSIAVDVAHRACALMDEGSPQLEVIKSVSSSNPGFTVDGAAQFTMIAAGVYCPQHLGQQVTHVPKPPPSTQPWVPPDPPPLSPPAA